MFKKILFIYIFLLYKFAFATMDNIVKADNFFNSGEFTKLEQLYFNNKNNLVINYLNAKAQLMLNKPSNAQSFIQYAPNSFMRNDLIHQLLIFYFQFKRYKEYQNTYYKLFPSSASVNETCGLDVSNIMLFNNNPILSNINYLITNNPTTWCSNLLLILAKNKKITDIQKNIMLFNLLTNNQSNLFNQYTKYLDLEYNRNDVKTNRYAIANYIIKASKIDPNKALNKLNEVKLDPITENFLKNYLAYQFALKFNFLKAKELFSLTDYKYFSNDEFEWRTKTFLYFMDWEMVIQSIEQMPNELKNKNVWLYWQAKAFDSINKTEQAHNLLEKIPNDYSYYSMLAKAELDEKVVFKTLPSKISELKPNAFSNEVISILNLYKLGVNNDSRSLINLATYEWYSIAKQASESELLSMSNMAYRNQFYDLSIFASNKISIRYIDFSFPTPFANLFDEYSHLNKIDPTYAFAISRQESRFNKDVIATDGGVGLMQLMPQTANHIMQRAGFANCYRTTAACNIKFGTWYLGNLYNKFSGNLIYSTAAYNAGPSRAKRWKDNLYKLDNKIQIELIPINGTKDYVQKVLSNKSIYDHKLNKDNTSLNLLNYINNLPNTHKYFRFSNFFKTGKP
ncbi:MAG TPA: transglycosylase SLT domain-containing protein [Burkholderiales bacterium]|nr:transglycosylase SLT domain-containing protein [Burkholderiales bacterium]